MLSLLLAYQDTLYALDFVNQELHRLEVKGEELLFSNTVSLDLSDFIRRRPLMGHYPPSYLLHQRWPAVFAPPQLRRQPAGPVWL